MGRKNGVTDEQLRELGGFETSPAFSTHERLVLEYAVEMTRTPVEISDELFARLQERFDSRQLVELDLAKFPII